MPSDSIVDPAERSSGTSDGSLPRYLLALLVIFFSALPYLPALSYGFVYDDDQQVLANPLIRSWHFVPSYFGSPVGAFYNPANSAAYYRPLFSLWFRLNYFLFGSHPLGWHALAIGVHVLAALLVFFLFIRYFSNAWIAAGAAVIFGVHPIHIESVAWVSGVTDALMAVALLGSLLLWMKSVESSRKIFLSASLVCFASALLIKETAIVLPAILFAHALAGIPAIGPRRQSIPQKSAGAIRAMLPYLVLAGLYLALRLLVLHGFHRQASWTSTRTVVLSAPWLLAVYLRHLIWPAGLSLFHDFAAVTNLSSVRFWLPLFSFAVLALAIALWCVRKSDAVLAVACAWIIFPLLPVIDFALFQRDDFLHDRYLYLSALGFAAIAALCLQALGRSSLAKTAPNLGVVLFLALILSLGLSATVQSWPWKNNLLLYTRAVQCAPENTMARNNLASEYTLRERFDEAANLLQSVLSDRPNFWLANYNYGYISYKTHNFVMAEEYLRRAVAIDPTDPDQYVYLGLTLFREGKSVDAVPMLQAAIQRRPDGIGYHYVLGMILQSQENLRGAADEYRAELRYNPADGAARTQLSIVERQLSGLH